jgi:hypothetical protein
MAYATADEVQALMAQFPIGSGSKPDKVAIETIIDDTASEIDSLLASVDLAVPVTTPAHFVRTLARVNAYGTAAAVLKSMFPASVGPGENPAWAFWEKRYQNWLTWLREGEGIPPDVPSGAASVGPSTYFTRNPEEEENLGTIAEPRMTVGKVF